MEKEDICVASAWRGQTISLFLRGGGNFDLKVGGVIELATSSNRYCIGSRSPATGKASPCPDEAQTRGSPQCDSCARREVVIPCHRCIGERCGNPVRREKCIQPDNHEIYLAFFSPGLVKVGVARCERLLERVAEQSARAAVSIGRADGKEIRNMEYHCRRLGYVDRISLSGKLDAWTVPIQQEASYIELERAAKEIRERLHGNWFAKARRLEGITPLPAFSERPRQLTHLDGIRLRGKIIGIYGHLILALSDAGDTVAFETASLIGYRLRHLLSDEVGQGQMALAI